MRRVHSDSSDMTEEEIFDVFLEQLDELHGFCQKLYGKECEVSQQFTQLYNLAEKTAKYWLGAAWNATEFEEYRKAELPELARLARAHNEQLRRTH